jgi:hypothetical protein
MNIGVYSEGQEMGAIAPAPENACKESWGRGRSRSQKKKNKKEIGGVKINYSFNSLPIAK